MQCGKDGRQERPSFRLAVEDTSIHHDGTSHVDRTATANHSQTSGEEKRAKSPSSLELNSVRGPPVLFDDSAMSLRNRCRSFPRITVSPDTSTATPSTSTRALSPYGQQGRGMDAVVDVDQLSLAGNFGLLRSVSARTLDSQPSRSQASSSDSMERPNRISPSGFQRRQSMHMYGGLRQRSSSCPIITYPLVRSRVALLYLDYPREPISDFNFEDENVNEATLDSSQNVHGFSTELQRELSDSPGNGNLPLYLVQGGVWWGANASVSPGSRSPRAVSPSIPCTCRTIDSFTRMSRSDAEDERRVGLSTTLCAACQSKQHNQSTFLNQFRQSNLPQPNSGTGQRTEPSAELATGDGSSPGHSRSSEIKPRFSGRDATVVGNRRVDGSSRVVSAREKCMRWLKSLSMDNH